MSFVLDNSRRRREETRGAFVASALEARQDVARHGQVMAAADVHKWLLAGAGKAARPRARKGLKLIVHRNSFVLTIGLAAV